jgi:carboxyl-terminal processing protease
MFGKNKIIGAILAFIIIILAAGVGSAVSCDSLFRLNEGTDLIQQAWSEVITNYVERDDLDAATLSHGAIEGMVEALDDPYSFFMTAEEYEVYSSGFEGEFEGIGAYVSVDNGYLIITAPIEGSPAEKAGIKAGDIIVEVEGELVEELTFTEALLKIRGPEGTTLNLLIEREEVAEPFIITITRGKVEVPSVILEIIGDYAHITITYFTDRTGDELSAALEIINKDSTKGIVLDVRSNPGGTIGTVIMAASHFIAEGKILDIRDNQGRITSYDREDASPYIDLPVVVLVDEYSASGSEVLAGALQDHGRVTIAGKTTYGKGSVNELIQLRDGSAIYITVARWLTPDGHLIEGEGVVPDIELDLAGDDAVAWAIDYLENN